MKKTKMLISAAVALIVICTMAMLISTCHRYSEIAETMPITITAVDSLGDGQQ